MIKINGTEHPFKFNMNAWIELGDYFETDDIFIFFKENADSKLRSPKALRQIVYCGIYGGYDAKEQECPVTVEEVGRHLKINNALKKLVIEAMFKGLIDPDAEPEEEEKKTVKSSASSTLESLPLES